MFQGFYIITEDCIGEATHPDGWTGPIKKDTPVALIYFDQHGMEFTTGGTVKDGNRQDGTERILSQEFRLEKPCPVEAACSCPHCGKIVPTAELEVHMDNDDNCFLIRNGGTCCPKCGIFVDGQLGAIKLCDCGAFIRRGDGGEWYEGHSFGG